MNGYGVIGSRAELFSNCGRVGSCGEKKVISREADTSGIPFRGIVLIVKAGLLKSIHQNYYSRDSDPNPKNISLAGYHCHFSQVV